MGTRHMNVPSPNPTFTPLLGGVARMEVMHGVKEDVHLHTQFLASSQDYPDSACEIV